MTLDEAVLEAKGWLQEEQDTPGGGSPFGWTNVIVQATDTLCRETDCLIVSLTRPSNAGRFTLPEGIRLGSGGVREESGGQTVRLVGFRVPGRAWEVDEGADLMLPLTGASVCPLPTWATDARAVKAAYLRCIQFPTEHNGPRAPLLAAEYQRLSGEIAARAAKEYRRLLYLQNSVLLEVGV